MTDVKKPRPFGTVLPPNKSGQRYGRYTVRGPDGKLQKEFVNLYTTSAAVARRKLNTIGARIARGELAGGEDVRDEAHRGETFEQAAQRVHEQRIADGVQSAKDEWRLLKAFAFPALGALLVARVTTGQINGALDEPKRAGKGKQTTIHLKTAIGAVFTALKREGAIKANPVDDAELPRFPDVATKTRAVLTDEELARYLAWQHPAKRFRMAALERQVMSVLARTFGGLRTGDLHALSWENLDSEQGQFEWGWAPRKKTAAPQLLEIPAMLRPILGDWWERQGRPKTGPVFPSRRGKRAAVAARTKAVVPKLKASHAQNFRRDLERAFGLQVWLVTGTDRNGEPIGHWEAAEGREKTRRERELFRHRVRAARRLPQLAPRVLAGASRCRRLAAAGPSAGRSRVDERPPALPAERYEDAPTARGRHSGHRHCPGAFGADREVSGIISRGERI
jgi:integrase